MGYIKKLKNNELVGGTDKHTIYPVTSTEAVFEEVSENEFKSQNYLNNHITNERIVDNTIENQKLKDDTIDMGKLNTQLKTIIQNAYDASWKVKEEPFSLETKYDANDVVYDPVTNSSYVSLTADNQGNPVNPEDEGYVEGKWRIIINGISAVESTEVINETVGILEDKFDTLEGNVDEAIEGLDNRIDEIQDDLSSLTAYETAATPSYDAQIPLKNLASTAQVGYYFCTVAGSETVKQVSNAIVSNTAVSQIGAFSLPPSGGHFKVKMSNAHTATSGSVTLRFGSVAATNKPLYYNGEPVSASNSWEENEVISVYYDGTYYQASNAQGGGGKAEKVKYDNSTSGFAANNMQGALDESLKFKGEEKAIIPSYLTTKNGYISTDGIWKITSTTGYFKHKSLSVNPGEWYKITANSNEHTLYAFLNSDQVPSSNNQPIDLVTNTSVSVVDEGKTQSIIIPEGCTTLVFNCNYHADNDVIPTSIIKMETVNLNDKIEELDIKADDASDYEDIPLPYNYDAFLSPVTKKWLRNNPNYRGSFIYVSDAALKYRITANANSNTRILALTSDSCTQDAECDTYATGDYDSSEFCISAGKTKIIKFPDATRFLWVAYNAGASVTMTPQYIGVERALDLKELHSEACLYNGNTQDVLDVSCQITAGDVLHIEVDKGDTAVYTKMYTMYNGEAQEYFAELSDSDIDKYVIAKSNADTLRMYSNAASSKFKVSKVLPSLLKDIEFKDICDNIAEVSIQDGTPVPYYLISLFDTWQRGPHNKSYILDIPDGATSVYIVPNKRSFFAFLSNNEIPESANTPVSFYESYKTIDVRENVECPIPNGCHYIAFAFHHTSGGVLIDDAPLYIGFRFSSVELLNKYKYEQPYSSIKLGNMHLILDSQTVYQTTSGTSHKESLSLVATSLIRTCHSDALGKYYLYLSEDHVNNSPIYMAYSDNLLDWTFYGVVATQEGLLGTAGDIEWPSVIWDDFNSRYLLYTHCLDDLTGLGYGQTEFICESADGIDWTYVKPFVTMPKNRFVGNFHNGYVKVHKDGGRWYATGLLGGGDASQTTSYYSYDGLNWIIDPMQACAKRSRCLPYTDGDVSDMLEMVIKNGEHINLNGRDYILAHGGTNTSGSTVRVARPFIQEVYGNRIHRGKAYALTNENLEYRDISIFTDDDGETYVISSIRYAQLDSNHKRRFYIFISKIKK